MNNRFNSVPFIEVIDYPEGLSDEVALASFERLRKEAQKLCQISVSIIKQEANDALQRAKISSQMRRRKKASAIYRGVRDQTIPGISLSLSFNDSGHVSAHLSWKGSSLRTSYMNAMGCFCDCPDQNRDYKLCKHKLALAGLVVEAGNRMHKNNPTPFLNLKKEVEALYGNALTLYTESSKEDPKEYEYLDALCKLMQNLDELRETL